MSEAAVISRNAVNTHTPTAGSVLIVDDESEIRESLETLLTMEGFAVQTAASGEDGLVQIGDRPFDLVLLDLALPGRDGMDILSEIRSHDPRLPVIMITARVETSLEARVSASGVVCLLRKPFETDHLVGWLNKLLG